jgi:RNA recognition motif-containing protein
MATKLFVGSLPYSVTDQDLEDLFKQFGDVTSAKVIFDRETNRSKGFGFVEFDDDDAAKKAVDQLNNSDMQGRTIVVNEARPQEARPPRRDFGDRDNRGGQGGGGYSRNRF